jgi:nitrogen fixation/metabolism regulation signal transduction histidine kinase
MDDIGREEAPEIQFGTGKSLFRKLKERLNSIKQTLNARRLEKEKDDRILIHAINAADPGLLCFDSRGEVLFLNETARNLIGDRELVHMNDIKDLNRKLWANLNEIKAGSPRVVRLFKRQRAEDGLNNEHLLSIRLKEVKIFDEYYRLFSLQDIQEELHKNESDSWQKIIRVLTHEIMNAVSPMLSLSKSMQSRIKAEDGKESGKIRDGLRMIETTGKGLLDFVEEYRRLSLLPPPKKKELRLKEALDGVLMMFEDEAEEKSIQLILEVEEHQEGVSADPQQFEMVLLNLLRNSFDSFKDAPLDLVKAIKICSRRKKDRMHIIVEDNGSGIEEELIDQVFVPFFSTKEQGSGIGLSLARQVMNNHEGSIHLESMPGEGTLVTLVF